MASQRPLYGRPYTGEDWVDPGPAPARPASPAEADYPRTTTISGATGRITREPGPPGATERVEFTHDGARVAVEFGINSDGVVATVYPYGQSRVYLAGRGLVHGER